MDRVAGTGWGVLDGSQDGDVHVVGRPVVVASPNAGSRPRTGSRGDVDLRSLHRRAMTAQLNAAWLHGRTRLLLATCAGGRRGTTQPGS